MFHDPYLLIAEHRFAVSVVAVSGFLTILVLRLFRRRYTITATVLGLISTVGLAYLAHHLESEAVLQPRARLEARNAELQAALIEAKKQQETSEQRHAAALARLANSTKEMRTAMGLPTSNDDPIDSAMDLMRGLQRDLLEAKRDAILTKRPIRQHTQTGRGPRELLLELLDSSLTTGYFRVEPITNDELIIGKRGKYYVVRMVAGTGLPLTFKDREYQLLSAEADFRTSFAQFALRVMRNIEGAELFVRGGADFRKYAGVLKDRPPQIIELFPSDGAGRYKGELVQRKIGEQISNADLPQLRAAYARELISDIWSNMRILEGEIREDGTARSVEFVMFVG
jgi:hypothetical protein